MHRPESKEERSHSRARASSRNPRLPGRLDRNDDKSSKYGHYNSFNEKPQVTWTDTLKETANLSGKNLDDLLGGNWQSVQLGSMGKFGDFDVDNESGEYYHPNPDEFSAGDKIYEEENEVNSSTNKEESVKDSIFRQSHNSFRNDANIKQSGLRNGPPRNITKNRNLGNSANYGSNITHEFYNTNGFVKKRPGNDGDQYIRHNGDGICDEINSRVQNAMRRIEKKYRHKTNLNSQENKLIEKYREREKVNSHIQEEKKNKSRSENYFSKTQNMGFSCGSSKKFSNKVKKSQNIDFSDLMGDYNHLGHAYLDKMNKDAEYRQNKINSDMNNIKDKITDLKKANDNQLRETFYNCLEYKIKDK